MACLSSLDVTHFDHWVLFREERIFRPLPLSPPQACMRGIMDDLNTSGLPLSSYYGVKWALEEEVRVKVEGEEELTHIPTGLSGTITQHQLTVTSAPQSYGALSERDT